VAYCRNETSYWIPRLPLASPEGNTLELLTSELLLQIALASGIAGIVAFAATVGWSALTIRQVLLESKQDECVAKVTLPLFQLSPRHYFTQFVIFMLVIGAATMLGFPWLVAPLTGLFAKRTGISAG
jgi:hypothetical protein